MTNKVKIIEKKVTQITVDRHTHLEGSIDPAWIKQQACKLGLEVPQELKKLWLKEKLDFDCFITAFNFSCKLLRNANDIKQIIIAATKRLPQDLPHDIPKGIDMWVSPFYLTEEEKLFTLDELWFGLDSGISEAKRNNINISIIIDAVNHQGVKHGHAVLDLIKNNKPDWIVGFSTGGLEIVPFKEWAKVFDRARNIGLKIAAHAGENGSGQNVRHAILDAGVERIIHGVKAAMYPDILELLAEKKIPVDICLTSNLSLMPNINKHPLQQMLQHGVRCALGTDDPGIIPCDLTQEWRLAHTIGLTKNELDLLYKYSNEDAWCFLKK